MGEVPHPTPFTTKQGPGCPEILFHFFNISGSTTWSRLQAWPQTELLPPLSWEYSLPPASRSSPCLGCSQGQAGSDRCSCAAATTTSISTKWGTSRSVHRRGASFLITWWCCSDDAWVYISPSLLTLILVKPF